MVNLPSEHETRRLEVVGRYAASDPGIDASLSEACRLATLLCHRSMSAVEIVGVDRVWLPAAAGLKVGVIERAEALSAQLLDARGTVVVGDCRADPRFASLALVSRPKGVRFYAAVPLVSPEDCVVGVLSVWDLHPGDLTPGQRESLEALGRMVMAQLNLRRRQEQLERLEEQHARVEQALRVTEAKFRGIFENTVVGIYQTSPEGQYLSANPMLARIYGYASVEDLVQAVNDIEHQLYVDPRTRERFKEALRQRDILEDFEAQIRRKDGRVIWIAENSRVVRDVEGRVLYYEGTVQDITARKAAEEQLRNSEMLYHSLVEDLPQNVFRKDQNERFIFANTRFCRTVGRPWGEIRGKTDFDLYPSDLAVQYQADDQRVMAEGRTVRVTERNVTPDGEVHWVEVIKTPLRDVAGGTAGIQGIFWDVTETKRLQDALAYERDLLQALLDHSPDVIYFKDPQSRFVKVSRALARRFNLQDPEALVGKTAADLWDPATAQRVQEEDSQLLRTGQPIVNAVEELVDHQGGRSWASVTKVPIYNRMGQILGLVGVARDITKLMQTEQALREAEERYRTIFENSVEGIFQTSLEGRFLRVNPALARIYGYGSPDELLAAVNDVRTQVYVEPGRREEFVRRILVEGSITGFESEIRQKGDRRTWVSESARVVRDAEGRPAYFEGTVEDISARKQVETERENARRVALESARLKAEFVATVSHEIRTPLNAIVPNTDRLRETHLDRQQQHLVESIDHGARMLLQIVNDILDFSKIEAGAIELEEIEFDLHELVERTLGFFAPAAHARHLELVGDIPPGVPRHLRGDPGRLGQVLNNLVGNAIKFTERGEVVVALEADPPQNGRVALRLRVRDTGIGIAPEARGRVFQAFAQADGSMSRRYGGTGLGLTITRRFVQLMGGSIDFESEVGRGTTFHVRVVLGVSTDPHPAEPARPVLAGRRVLVVEDNATQRAAIIGALSRLGAEQVSGAEEIGGALDAARVAARDRQPFDLVCFDSELPGSDLVQTTRRLRAGAGQARLVALTAPGAVAHDRGLAAAGVAGSIAKPLRLTRLASEMAVLLGEPLPPETTPRRREEPVGQPGRGIRILLVEDNLLNQNVASELLSRLGAEVDPVSGGHAAIDAWRNRTYDLILMDCQMPEMDGYETTRRLRELEASLRPGGPRVRIVALSANALSGDRERGLAAGMDDYLTKPLRQPELLRVLRDVRGAEPGPGSEPDPAHAPAPAHAEAAPPHPAPPTAATGDSAAAKAVAEVPVLDPAPLLALASPDDPDILQEFVRQFSEDGPRRLDRLRGGWSARDARVLRAEAHGLKGSAAYMGARRLVAACAALEEAAKAGDLGDAEEMIRTLQAEFDEARRALVGYLAGTGAEGIPPA